MSEKGEKVGKERLVHEGVPDGLKTEYCKSNGNEHTLCIVLYDIEQIIIIIIIIITVIIITTIFIVLLS